tara:strand:+ start:121 stop:1419 length:1299 start_codon:yes stop_codon:yes gene_type:complete
MLSKRLRFKLKSTSDELTSQSGIVLFGKYIFKLGLSKLIDSIFPLPKSFNGYLPSEYIFPLVLNLHGGGSNLDDIKLIKEDTGLRKLLNINNVSSSWALGNWLRSHSSKEGIANIDNVNHKISNLALMSDNVTNYTLDIDASEIVAEKMAAQYTYKKNKGYMPILGHLAENGLVLHSEFREGNIPPADNNYQFVKDCVEKMPFGKRIGSFRADSATYQSDIVNYCESREISYAIGGRLDTAVKDIIKHIPEQDWHSYNNGHYNTDDQIAETIHSMETTNSFRLIIKRSLLHNDLLGKDYIYHVIISNRKNETAEETLNWYHQRGETSENRIKELKIGFNMEKMPCGQFAANALYFYIGVLSYNLSIMFKTEILPEEFKKKKISSIRWRLYQIPGKIVTTARYLYLKIQIHHLELFQIILSRIYNLNSSRMLC